jgi:protein gp37
VSSTSTAIEWTDATWNPVTGCSKVSEGCRNCYAAALAPRLATMGQKGYTELPWTKPNAPKNVMTHDDRLAEPLRWKKPRRVFVNSMSDLFHEQIPDEFVNKVFAIMALARRHTFQILTKRPERMAAYAGAPDRAAQIGAYMTLDVILDSPELRDVEGSEMARWRRDGVPWPLPNAWLGTSVEDGRVLGRVDQLRWAPATIRFLSCEPLIGPLDGLDLSGIHWVIVGGESGHGHRPIKADWIREIRELSTEAGVAFFFKQWGGAKPKSGGRELDGRTWDEMPDVSQGCDERMELVSSIR